VTTRTRHRAWDDARREVGAAIHAVRRAATEEGRQQATSRLTAALELEEREWQRVTGRESAGTHTRSVGPRA
jgi:hypothetical protein